MSLFKKNIIHQLLIFIGKILSQLFFPTLMLSLWGKDNLDLWFFFLSVPAFLSLFQLSVTAPIRNRMSIDFSNKNFKDLNFNYQHSYLITFINGLILLLISICYIKFQSNNILLIENIDTFWIVISTSILILFNGPLYLALTYRGDLTKLLRIEMVYDFFYTILIPLSFFIVENFQSIFIIFFTLNLIKLTTLYVVINDDKIKKTINIFSYNFQFTKKIIFYSIGNNLEMLASILRGPGTIFILGSVGFLNFVTLISTARTLFYFLPQRIFNILFSTVTLEISKNFKKKNFSKSKKKKFLKLIFYSLICILLFVIISVSIGKAIYLFWLNNEINIDKELILYIVLDASLIIFSGLVTLPLKSINKYNLIGLIDFLLNVILFVILYNFNFFFDLTYAFKVILYFSIVNFIIKILLTMYILSKSNI